MTACFLGAVYLRWRTLLFATVFISVAANPSILNEYLSSFLKASHNGVPNFYHQENQERQGFSKRPTVIQVHTSNLTLRPFSLVNIMSVVA